MNENKLKSSYGGGLQAIDFSDVSRQIEQAKKKNKRLKQGSVVLVVAALLLGGLLFNYFVWRYAVIDNLQITQDSSERRKADFAFNVKSGGVVSRGYEKAVNEDIVSTGQNASFHWLWYVPPSKQEFTVYVRSRWGIFPTWETKTFSLSAGR